jgi:ssDNA-binding protein
VSTSEKDLSKVITPVAILSFPWLFEPQPAPTDPKTQKSTGKAMYSAALIFDEATMAKYPQFGTSLDALRAAANFVLTEKFGDKLAGYLRNPNFKTGFRTDGQEWGYPEGSVHINPRNERRPGLVYLWPEAGTTKPAIVPEDAIKDAFYPGALVRASVRAFAFDRAGNRGASFALNNIQLIDGTVPRLDGRKAPQDEFEADATKAPASLDDIGAE